MTKFVIDQFTTKFLAAVDEQISWDKDQIKKLFFLALSDVLLEIIDSQEDLD